MECYSTNNLLHKETLRNAILMGLAPDKGLFMPSQIPQLPAGFFQKLPSLSLAEIAFEVSSRFLGDEIPADDLQKLVDDAFNFEIPLKQLDERIHVLELFHGPTLAFKDVGARFMSRAMAHLNKEELIVLAATSGDTGSAVASGFYDVPGIQVVILYPSGKVSEIQEKQLTTYGKNIHALEVEGTFDDCQAMVKNAFQDKTLGQLNLTTANSINLARLIPQSFYYFYAIGQLGRAGADINFSVPSGNFGNITAGLFAKRMGLELGQFIAATNVNDIVPAYLKSGLFEAKPSVRTISNAMDVGNPSNFARIAALHKECHEDICAEISGFSYTDEETVLAMQELNKKYAYVADPHTAIAYAGLKEYARDNGGTGIFLATAHPVKFLDVVKSAVDQQVEIPARLQEIMERPKKATSVSNNYDELRNFVLALK